MRCEGIHVDAARANYDTSRNGLQRAGLVIADSNEPFPPFVWVDGILRKEDAIEHPPYQRFNKIPGMDFICYKCTLFKTLNDLQKIYPSVFDVYPKTYLLPKEFLEFQREHKAICGRSMQAPSWVVKPKNSCCGRGISIVQSVAEAQAITYEAVIQQYIRPFLIDGHKFDFRFYILIASLNPLSIFIYKEGIARFCTQIFEFPSKSNRDKKFMHLTNTAINIENSKEPPSTFTKLASEVLADISKRYQGDKLWSDICEVSRAAIIGIYGATLNNLPKKCDEKTPQQKRCEMILKKRKVDPKIMNPEEFVDKMQKEAIQMPASITSNASNTNINVNSNNLNSSLNVGSNLNSSSNINVNSNVNLSVNGNNSVNFGNQRKNLISSNKSIPKIARPFVENTPMNMGTVINYQVLSQQQPQPQQLQSISRVTNSSVQRRSLSLSPERDHKGKASSVFAANAIDDESGDENENMKNLNIEEDSEATSNSSYFASGTNINNGINDVNVVNETNGITDANGNNETNGTTGENADGEKVIPQFPTPPPLPLKKRFFHILGIDIMIDSEMNPKVLELNDRPSLGVTVDFEQELKEGLIAEAFEHVNPNGEWFGFSKNSRWKQIYPLLREEAARSPYPDIINRFLNPMQSNEVQKQPALIQIPKRNFIDYKSIRKDAKRKRKKKNRRESK